MDVPIPEEIKISKRRICTWNKEEFGNIFQDKKFMMEQLEKIHKEEK